MEISIYLSNLRKYVEGNENGRWIPLPMEAEKLKKVFNDIVGDGEEWIILDYNAPFEISQYENVAELNKFMFEISEYDEEDVKLLFKVRDDKEEVLKALEDGNYSIVSVDRTPLNDCADYGLSLHESGYNNLFSQPIPEDMIDYIDFEQVYTCLSVNDGWQEVTINEKDRYETYLVTIWNY